MRAPRRLVAALFVVVLVATGCSATATVEPQSSASDAESPAQADVSQIDVAQFCAAMIDKLPLEPVSLEDVYGMSEVEILGAVEDRIAIVFLDPEATTQQRTAIEAELVAFPGAAIDAFFDKQQAYEEFLDLGFPSEVQEATSVEAMPTSFRVTLDDWSPEAVQGFRDRFESQPGVREVVGASAQTVDVVGVSLADLLLEVRLGHYLIIFLTPGVTEADAAPIIERLGELGARSEWVDQLSSFLEARAMAGSIEGLKDLQREDTPPRLEIEWFADYEVAARSLAADPLVFEAVPVSRYKIPQRFALSAELVARDESMRALDTAVAHAPGLSEDLRALANQLLRHDADPLSVDIGFMATSYGAASRVRDALVEHCGIRSTHFTRALRPIFRLEDQLLR